MASIKGNGSLVRLDHYEKGPNKGKLLPNGKCRHWKLVISLGRDPQQAGKYPQTSRRFTGSYSDAQVALAEFVDEVKSREVLCSYPKSTTVAKYAADYLARLDRLPPSEMAQRTRTSHRNNINNVTKCIGNMLMVDLNPHAISDLYSKLALGSEGGRQYSMSGRPLSGKSLSNVHKSLMPMLRAAVRDGLISPAAFEGVRQPKADTKRRDVLSEERAIELWKALDPCRHFELALGICLTTGLRRSEALGLVWGDYDGACLSVSRSLDEDGNVKDTKSEAGEAVVPLNDAAIYFLDRARRAAVDFFGEDFDLSEKPIVSHNRDSFCVPHTMTRWWGYTRKKYGLEGFTIHDMRRTFTSLLAKADVHPRLMQELVRDSDLETVMQVYTVYHDEERAQAVRSVPAFQIVRQAASPEPSGAAVARVG